MQAQLSWLEACTIGLLQGATELFPVSSLGHSVLIPAILGGSWSRDLDVSTPESPYLAFIVGLHVATAIALIVYFWRDWLLIIAGFASSLRHRRISTEYERLAWLLIVGTIPVGLAGLVLEHTLRAVLAKPSPTAVFLIINGVILFAAERLKRLSHEPDGEQADLDGVLSRIGWGKATLIGASQCLALAPGISRSGIAMSTGLLRGLSHESAARFSFLLATPVILAAGVLKIPDLIGPLGDGIRPQVILGSVMSGLSAYLSVRFLSRYFENRSLRPFAWYCVGAGTAALILLNT